MEKLAVYCLKYARSVLPERMVFADGSAEKTVPIAFAVYLICAGERKILVDAGCDTMPGFRMEEHISPAEALEQLGVRRKEITDVIITHAHHDHIQAVGHFEQATVHITQTEYQRGKPHIPQAMKVNLFEEELELLPGLRVIRWGGHAKGSAIVSLETGGQVHIFAGDECYTNQNLAENRCTGSFCNREKAEEFVARFRTGTYCVHTSHDNSLKTKRIL